MLSEPTPDIDLDRFANSVAIDIVWTENIPCGIVLEDATGCFTPATPNVIYAKPIENDNARRFVVLHEIGHALAYRAGTSATAEQSEIDADRFAESFGATRY